MQYTISLRRVNQHWVFRHQSLTRFSDLMAMLIMDGDRYSLIIEPEIEDREGKCADSF